ncbi:GH36-type glycosyl hydrolase domain-containing protein [Salinispira pacifica]|uniref:Cyclic beta-1,2-glucan synthase n=1 Tax=Salinispira pacifica TaxID=1307761 RepID=V5WJZ5_9SPIO|nr:hypothetical protein [Salinispira pacifica]AHC15980.1 hypothetical protein L21SP2_2628 [Salinispira pacifica]
MSAQKTSSEHWRMEEGKFILTRPLRHRPWYNYLSNGEYGLKISHLGDGFATTLTEPRVVVTNYDFFTPNRGRFVYVREGGEVWNPGFYPTANPLDEYRCVHQPGMSSLSGTRNGVSVESSHFLPREGSYEIWSIVVKNLSEQEKQLQLFTLAEFLLYDNLAVDPVYFSWFTNSRYRHDIHQMEFFRTDSTPVFGFCRSDTAPQAFESSLVEFTGEGDYLDPEGVRRGMLGNNPSAGDPYAASFQYDISLAPGESRTINLFIGQGETAAGESLKSFPDNQAVRARQWEIPGEWSRKLHREEWLKVEDPRLRSYVSGFLPYQIIQQARGNVRSTFRGYRDVAQDAMGLSFFDPGGSAKLIRTLCTKMMDTGRCLRQWNTGGGLNDERDFRDLPLWLAPAVQRYLDQTDDASFLQEEHEYFNSTERGSIWEHMLRGLDYVLTYGPHGLLEMGKGDWNDALSGLGPRGESLWLNEMAYYSISILQDLASRYNLQLDFDGEAEKEKLYQGVVNNWNGEWFLRGYHENGDPVGGDERIFLLPQAWFTISGMGERDPGKASRALDSMLARLANDNGLLICHPGFENFDPVVGNLSCLAPGVAENFAVYNHASAFAVYALLKAGRSEAGLDYLSRLLPFRKDAAKTGAEPYVLVNYYNGGYYPVKDGQGGIPWLTGTVHWLALSLFDHIFPQNIRI